MGVPISSPGSYRPSLKSKAEKTLVAIYRVTEGPREVWSFITHTATYPSPWLQDLHGETNGKVKPLNVTVTYQLRTESRTDKL